MQVILILIVFFPKICVCLLFTSCDRIFNDYYLWKIQYFDFWKFFKYFEINQQFFEDKPTYETKNYSEERNSLQNDIVLYNTYQAKLTFYFE